jgi:hypothetical protein
VEFRCRGDERGKVHHLLAVIYDSASGPLAVSTALRKHNREDLIAMSEHYREFLAGLGQLPKGRRLAWDPNPRLIEVDEPFSDDPVPLNCRCGDWPHLTRDHFKAALDVYRCGDAGRQGQPVVIGVSMRALHSARATLCLF